MKNTFWVCVLLSAAGAFINLFLKASGNERIAHLLQSILGILLLLTFFGGMTDLQIPQIDIAIPNGEEFSEIRQETMKEVIQLAEEKLAGSLVAETEQVFKVSPMYCCTEINTETLRLQKVILIFSKEEIFVSAYEIKSHFTETYGAETEVVFE